MTVLALHSAPERDLPTSTDVKVATTSPSANSTPASILPFAPALAAAFANTMPTLSQHTIRPVPG